jgi:hypothetical protein
MRTQCLHLRNLWVDVVHSTAFCLAVKLNAYMLEELVRTRAANRGIVNGDCVEIERNDNHPNYTNFYVMRYAREETRESLLDIVRSIEKDVLEATRQEELLSMIDE